MLRFTSVTLVALVAVSGAGIGQEGIDNTIRNEGSDVVTGSNSFPLAADGMVIDDNVGGHYDDVPPGGTATFTLTSLVQCEPIRFYVRLKSRSERGQADLQLAVDTCNDKTIVVRD